MPANHPLDAFKAADDVPLLIAFCDQGVTTAEVNEDTVGNGKRIQEIRVNLDGDGVFQPHNSGQNANELDTAVSNLTGTKIVHLKSNLRLNQNGEPTQNFSQGKLYMSNNQPGGLGGSPQPVGVLNNGLTSSSKTPVTHSFPYA
ncbi:MAG: hypothetical protein AAF761_01860 [Pseudomonadota bacterium]